MQGSQRNITGVPIGATWRNAVLQLVEKMVSCIKTPSAWCRSAQCR
jgi:hypothetical protein